MPLHPLELRHLLKLALDIALILYGNFNFLRNIGGQRRAVRVKGGQLRIMELRPLQKSQQ